MFVVIDIGGTKTDIAVFKSRDISSKIKEEQFPTFQSYTEEVSKIKDVISEFDIQAITSINISLAGIVGYDNTIEQVSNLPDYQGKPLAQDLNAIFNVNVRIVQDSTCSALCEYLYGDIKKHKKIVHLILGTGLGGTFLDNRNSLTISPIEPGGMIIDKTDAREHEFTELKGILEAYVGGRNIGYHYDTDLSQLPDDHEIWEEVANYLTIGINNIACILKPEIVVIGGGLAIKRQKALSSVQEKINAYHTFVTPPIVEFSQISGNSSLLGALALNFVNNVTLNT